jgi:hypothetical protein
VSSGPLSRLGPGAEPQAAALVVVVACHGVVCTLPVGCVDRLVRRDEVEAFRPTAGKGPAGGSRQQLVTASGDIYAAWNLGTMLELPPLSAAWVLMQVPSPEGPVAMALRTGACLMVQSAPPSVPVPPGIFRARSAAMTGAFPTTSLRGKQLEALVGICLDPLQLWSAAELESSRLAVEQAEGPPS